MIWNWELVMKNIKNFLENIVSKIMSFKNLYQNQNKTSEKLLNIFLLW